MFQLFPDACCIYTWCIRIAHSWYIIFVLLIVTIVVVVLVAYLPVLGGAVPLQRDGCQAKTIMLR